MFIKGSSLYSINFRNYEAMAGNYKPLKIPRALKSAHVVWRRIPSNYQRLPCGYILFVFFSSLSFFVLWLALWLYHLAAALTTWVQIPHEFNLFPLHSGAHLGSICVDAGDGNGDREYTDFPGAMRRLKLST